jgi:hypothetical protein
VNQWAFVIAAYAVTIFATLGLVAWAIASMRRAESYAERLRSPE